MEAAVLAELEEKVAVAEGRLLVELQREREGGSRISRQTWATLSRVEQLAVELYLAKDVLVKRRVKRKKKKEEEEKKNKTQEKLAGGRYFFAPLFLTVTCLTLELQFFCGRRHSLRAAESDPHGPVGRKTIEVPQLQHVDK